MQEQILTPPVGNRAITRTASQLRAEFSNKMSSDTKLLKMARVAIQGIESISPLKVEIFEVAGMAKTYNIKNVTGVIVFSTKSIRELNIYWAGLEMGIQVKKN